MKKASEKILYIIGGVNGAGKSTFAENAMANSKYTYLNPDKMAFKISGNYSTSATKAAGKQVIEILKENVKYGKPIIWETTLGSNVYKRISQLYKNNGYLIDLTYIFLIDEETHHERIAERVAAGGHDIEIGLLEKRFKKRVASFDEALETGDSWRMLCNQNPWFELVAFGHGQTKMISNYDLYKHFYETTPNIKSKTMENFKKFIGFSIKTNKK